MKQKEQITSPFHSVAGNLISKGLIILPLRVNEKAPLVSNWTSFTLEQSKEYLNKQQLFNAGLLLGEATGIVALDFDNNVDGLHQKILKVCGQSDVVKKGAKGGTIFFRYNGEKSKKWKRNGEMVLELLSTGTQTVIPPSIHPGTQQPYKYTKGKSLEDIKASDLPYLPANFHDKMDELIDGKEVFKISSNLDIIGEALYYVEADDYDTWLKCGMALKNDFGDDGFDVWEKWSATNPKYNPNELFPKWQSFKGEGITSASVFQMAIKNGFIPPKNASSFYNVNNAKTEFDRWRLKGRPVGLSTGIEPFDRLLHIRPKEFTIITGTPNSGKSEFLDFLLYNLVKNHSQKVMFASFEKEPTDHVESFVHRITGKGLENRTSDEESRALDIIQESLFFYNHLYETRDIDGILDRAQELVDKVGLNVLAIDPFSYVTSKEISNEFAHVRYVCIKITKFAKKNNIHVVLVAHPKTLENRKVDKEKQERLTLYAISGGANFYNKCDNGIVVSRDGSEVDIDIQKVRKQDVDTTGNFVMNYDKATRSYTTFNGGF